jgi:hypothetical protein
MSRGILLILFSIVFLSADAQEETVANREWEQLVEQQDLTPELDENLLEWEALKRKPIHISRLSLEQLSLFGFTPVQIQAYFRYVQMFGIPSNKFELQAIPYWDKQLIQQLLAVLDFSPPRSQVWKSNKLFKDGEHELLFRTSSVLQKAKGFQQDSVGKRSYAGSPQRIFIRYGYQLNRMVQAGFSLEKDAGEPFARQLNRLADFSGFHLFIRGIRTVKAVALGDFSVNAGQGLVVWQGMAFGKGAAGAGVFRQGPLLKAYRSAGEINFFRGAAVHLSKGKWEALTWGSNRKKSATITYENNEAVAFSSLSVSGYHRNSSEIAGRKKLGELVAGSIIRYQSGNLKIGFNQLYQRFSLPWFPREEPYSNYYFRGQSSYHSSLDYSWGKKQFFLFGEVARGGKGYGGVQGLLASIDKRVDWTLVYRNFQPSYHAVYANAVSEQAAVRNEEGIYTNLEIKPVKGWLIQVYADWYRFPWLRFRSDAPGNGREARFLIQWEKRRSWLVYGYFRMQSKPENGHIAVTNSITSVTQQNLRIHIQRNAGKNLLISTRFDGVFYKKTLLQNGWGIYADAKWIVPQRHWQFAARVHWFRTDGYETRIYSYERDLLYSYSIPAIFDHGLRYYLQWQGKWKIAILPTGTLKWWIRWSQSRLSNQESIGSGWDELPGSRRSEWKFQLIVDW